jgi:hypothetical protein
MYPSMFLSALKNQKVGVQVLFGFQNKQTKVEVISCFVCSSFFAGEVSNNLALPNSH